VSNLGLPSTYLGPVNRILRSLEHNFARNLLLGKAITRFVAAKDKSDREVLIAVQELEDLAMESVLRSPEANSQEYEEVCVFYFLQANLGA
jgi:hypothetical protein